MEPEPIYVRALAELKRSGLPFMVGGAYGLEFYTGVSRRTKDLDLFVLPEHCGPILELFARAGHDSRLLARHWLGKTLADGAVIDVIFGSGNGLCAVDADWLSHAVRGEVLGVEVLVIPPEEMLWSKYFVMERGRYDGADVAHLLRARGRTLDWRRLVARFGDHWPVLLSHMILFRYVYPAESAAVPDVVLEGLLRRATGSVEPASRLCRGTLLSAVDYWSDVRRGDLDARLPPFGALASEDLIVPPED